MTLRGAPLVYACLCADCNRIWLMGGARAGEADSPNFKHGEVIEPWLCPYCGMASTIQHRPGNAQATLSAAFEVFMDEMLREELGDWR